MVYLYFWADILEEVSLTQQYLQTEGLFLDKVVTKLEALSLFLHEKCSYLVEHAIEQALSKSDQYGISVEKRFRFKKKRMAGEAVQSQSLLSASEGELLVSVPKLTSLYDELSEDELLKEIPRLRSHLNTRNPRRVN